MDKTLTAGSLAEALGRSPWAYPLLESLHIVGIALLLGNLVLLELRIWGRSPELPVAALARLALPLVLAGFGVVGATGLLMFASRPGELLATPAFVWKLGLVTVAAANAALFHLRDGLRRQDSWARAQTVLSLGLWVGAIMSGRWIAYA